MVSVIENRLHVFKNKKKEPNLFLFFQNKNQFLNRFHVFVRDCLVSVVENRFHVLKNLKKKEKKKEPNLFLFSYVLVFS